MPFFLSSKSSVLLCMARKTHPTGYWTFFCNPRKWEIDEFLVTEATEDSWRVNKWQKTWFEEGQLGVIRVGIDSRTRAQLKGKSKLKPGIYAMVEVLGEAAFRSPTASGKYYIQEGVHEKNDWRVRIRYLMNMLNEPLLFEYLKAEPLIVDDPYLIPGIQARTMPLQPPAFRRLMELSGLDKRYGL